MSSLQDRIKKFEPATLEADFSHLTPNDKLALTKLVRVGKLLDQLYIRQAWSGNEALLERLKKEGDQDKLLMFELCKGPWDRVAGEEAWIEGVPNHPPPGGNFYPEDMTKAEFEAWTKTLSEIERKHATGFYHVVKRNEQGQLYLSPYSKEYADLLEPAANLLKEAADLVEDASLRSFLNSRADAFRSNDYLPSELDWLRISPKSPIDITCGPYEVYTDKLFSSKSAYEFYLMLRDFPSSSLLEKFASSLEYVESHLPVPEEYKNRHLTKPPIVVVNEVYNGGDVAVPMTAAYNLPNDEDAIAKGGSKLVLIKNVQKAKYNKVLIPISEVAVDENQVAAHLSFEAFFTHVLLHEVAHSNGPHYTVGDHPVPVRARLQEFHSAMEEAKADITGLFAANLLIKQGTISDITREQFWVTFLASAFRSMRFGIGEAHGLGVAIQFNYLLAKGGFHLDATGRYSVDFDKIEDAVRDLTHDILVLQGNGDKGKVQQFVEQYGKIDEDLERILDALKGVPVDVRPVFTLDKN
ncbi:uncharacterized protein VTP21DRAFT_7042 [Calcarisporiella thermophila]|uniref:uncharacterized protein n=1 Tax=Calcarisporiella thermophila TaxID=911321 RepID=UPI0037424C77